MFFPFARQCHIIVLRFRVVEFPDWNQRDPRSVLDYEAFRELSRGPRGNSQLRRCRTVFDRTNFHSLQRCREALLANRLQQIIHGMDFKRLHCVFVVRSNKNYRHIRANQLQHVKAGQLRHLHIQKKQVWLMFRHRFHRFQTVSAFRDDFNFFMRAQQFAQHLPRQLFVIHNNRAQFLGFSLTHFGSPDLADPISAAASSARANFVGPVSAGTDSAGPNSAGNDMVTRNLSSSASARNVASFPYRASRRLRTFFSPTPLRFRSGASSSRSFSTNIAKRPSRTLASRRIIPPSSIEAIPWLTAFSSNGCNSSAGIMQRLASSSICSSMRKRAPKRTFSIAMNFSSKSNSSEKGITVFSPMPSVKRRKSASSKHISLARAPSTLVNALIEFKLLNRKCGLICARSARSSASRANTLVCITCISTAR